MLFPSVHQVHELRMQRDLHRNHGQEVGVIRKPLIDESRAGDKFLDRRVQGGSPEDALVRIRPDHISCGFEDLLVEAGLSTEVVVNGAWSKSRISRNPSHGGTRVPVMAKIRTSGIDYAPAGLVTIDPNWAASLIRHHPANLVVRR